MAAFFEQEGYSLMPSADGPISFYICKRHNVLFDPPHLIEIQRGDERKTSIRPYNAWLCSESITELTAVTPENPKTDPFSQWAVQVLFMSCLG
jgi:hypothetical protein